MYYFTIFRRIFQSAFQRNDKFAVIPLDEFTFGYNRFSVVAVNLPCAEGGEQDACKEHVQDKSCCAVGQEGQRNRSDQRIAQICDDIDQDLSCKSRKNTQGCHLA